MWCRLYRDYILIMNRGKENECMSRSCLVLSGNLFLIGCICVDYRGVSCDSLCSGHPTCIRWLVCGGRLRWRASVQWRNPRPSLIWPWASGSGGPVLGQIWSNPAGLHLCTQIDPLQCLWRLTRNKHTNKTHLKSMKSALYYSGKTKHQQYFNITWKEAKEWDS